MASSDERAILQQAYGRYNRVIEYNSAQTRGLMCLPATDDAPNGWGDPRVTEGGQEINPPLGTVGGGNPSNLFVRSPGDVFGLVRSQNFSNIGEVDWKGLESSPGAGDQPAITFKGPRSRYFPTGGLQESQYKIPDPNLPTFGFGFFQLKQKIETNFEVVGVALRDQDGQDRRFVYVTGNAQDGFEFFDKDINTGIETSIGVVTQADIASAVDHVVDFILQVVRWPVPWHFSADGTKALTTLRCLSGPDAQKYKKVEVTLDPFVVDYSAALAGSRNFFFVKTVTTNNPPTTQTPSTEALPDCPDRALTTFVNAGDTTVQTNANEDQTQVIAHDYDPDGNVVSLSWAVQNSSASTFFNGSEQTTTKQCCKPGPNCPFANDTSILTLNTSQSIERSEDWTFSINGGPGNGLSIGYNIVDSNNGFSVARTISDFSNIGGITGDEQSGSLTPILNRLKDHSRLGRAILQFPYCDLRTGHMMTVVPQQAGTVPYFGYGSTLGGYEYILGITQQPCFNMGPGPISELDGRQTALTVFQFRLCSIPQFEIPAGGVAGYAGTKIDYLMKLVGPGVSREFLAEGDPDFAQSLIGSNSVGPRNTSVYVFSVDGILPTDPDFLPDENSGSDDNVSFMYQPPTIASVFTGNGVTDYFAEAFWSAHYNANTGAVFARTLIQSIGLRVDDFDADYIGTDPVALSEITGANPRFHPIGIV